MSQSYRFSGKRVPSPSAAKADCKWTVRPGGWIIAESPTGERHRLCLSEASGRITFSLHGRLWLGTLVSDRRQSSQSGAGADQDLVAQFPGKVRKILVKEGDMVREGVALILVEAMKMEFSIKAPFSGRVTKLRVQEAQPLSPGDRFLDLEPEAEPSGK